MRWILFLIAVRFSLADIQTKEPKNLIIVIADGAGKAHFEALRHYKSRFPTIFDRIVIRSSVQTCNAHGHKNGKCDPDTSTVTESAAAATAIASGKKVSNDVISIAIPGDEKPIKTILEHMQSQQKSSGLVSTKLISDATPAAFASHAKSRSDTKKIIQDYFTQTKPNVLLGADEIWYRPLAQKAAYMLAFNKRHLQQLLAKNSRPCTGHFNCPFVYGGFGEHEMVPGKVKQKLGLPLEVEGAGYFKYKQIPHLSEMTSVALGLLKTNRRGFFLMIESALIDCIGHYNTSFGQDGAPSSAKALVEEMLELERTIQILIAFVKENPDTLVLITADHETGGLELTYPNLQCINHEDFCLPLMNWRAPFYENSSVAQHTKSDVWLFAFGKFAQVFQKKTLIDNTEIVSLAYPSFNQKVVNK